jgi:hypothetical protein
MSETNTPSRRNMLKNNISKILLCFIAVLWTLSTFLAFMAFRQPLQLEEMKTQNTIQEKTLFEYQVEVIPCTLYPNGGIVIPEGDIMTAITRRINIHIESWVTADKPVVVKGSQQVLVKLVAEGLWERDFSLGNKAPFEITGDKNRLIQREYSINPLDFFTYIGSVEEETKVRASKYFLKIKPVLEGEIKHDDTTFALDKTPELTFEIGNNQMKLVRSNSKTPSDEAPINKVEYTKTTPVQTIRTIPQKFILFGKGFSIIGVRYSACILSIFCIAIVLGHIWRGKKRADSLMTESQKIDKKYSARIVKVEHEYRHSNPFYLESFKALLKIADEKEQPILRFKTRDKYTSYCVIDGGQQYVYIAVDKVNTSTSGITRSGK